jgi:hypothetical protein
VATANLPRNITLPALAHSLGQSGVLGAQWPELVINFPTGAFVDVGAVAFLCSWADARTAEGRRIHLRGDSDVLGYLERIDLQAQLGIAHDLGNRQDETGRFLPIRRIASSDDVFATVNALCDLVLHQFDNSRAFVGALEWAANEIIDNILIHSETKVPGVVCAQYFPVRHRLDIGICDLGRGIKASLGTTRHIWSHGDAVTSALKRGVTRDQSVGQGNGMAGSLEIATLNGGAFEVWTGDVVFRVDEGIKKGFAKIPELPGTGIMFSLDTRRPVDVTTTWIASGDWTFINAEAQRIAEAGGFDVAAACVNTGSRPPAERLRRKLVALLPEMTGPLRLDFSRVRSASSSFLDELLGRMAQDHELGERLFESRIQIEGMEPTIRKMANVVIAQRLGRIPLDVSVETDHTE